MTDKEYLAFKQHATLLTTQTFSNRPTRLRHKHYVLKSTNQSTYDSQTEPHLGTALLSDNYMQGPTMPATLTPVRFTLNVQFNPV